MIQELIAKIQGRSTKWPAVRRHAIEQQPFCSGCNAKKNLDVHHITPFHLDFAKELQPDNLIVLCRRCHLMIGHLDDWQSFNPGVRTHAAFWLQMIKQRGE